MKLIKWNNGENNSDLQLALIDNYYQRFVNDY